MRKSLKRIMPKERRTGRKYLVFIHYIHFENIIYSFGLISPFRWKRGNALPHIPGQDEKKTKRGKLCKWSCRHFHYDLRDVPM